MRRRRGTLLSIELAILGAGLDLRAGGQSDFYGYGLAKELADREGARRLTAYGTLYRALDRLEAAGLLESRNEDPTIAAAAGRPLRTLYRVTSLGEQALAAVQRNARSSSLRMAPGEL